MGDVVDEAVGGGVCEAVAERDDEGEAVADGEDDADAELDPVAVSVEEGVAVRDGVGLTERVAEAVRDTLAVTVADVLVVVDEVVALMVDVACAVKVIDVVTERLDEADVVGTLEFDGLHVEVRDIADGDADGESVSLGEAVSVSDGDVDGSHVAGRIHDVKSYQGRTAHAHPEASGPRGS